MATKDSNRKALKPSLRFEIFKRDGFTCQYCGGRSPEVVLEVDHVIAVANGGSNDPANLVTSCYLCNRGKSATPLTESTIGNDLHDTTVYLLEREMQLREYNAVMDMIREREDEDIDEILAYWEDLTFNRRWLSPNSLRHHLKTFSRNEILEAIDIAASKRLNGEFGRGEATSRYVFGILNTKKRRGEVNER